MNPMVAIRLLATMQVLAGALAIPRIALHGPFNVSSGWWDERMLPLAMLWALASIAAGVALWFRPKCVLISTLLLAPQAISFAGSAVAFAFSLWPVLGLEFTIAPDLSDVSMRTLATMEPMLFLRTDRDYIGFGVGFNFVAIGAIALLAWAWATFRRNATTPGHAPPSPA